MKIAFEKSAAKQIDPQASFNLGLIFFISNSTSVHPGRPPFMQALLSVLMCRKRKFACFWFHCCHCCIETRDHCPTLSGSTCQDLRKEIDLMNHLSVAPTPQPPTPLFIKSMMITMIIVVDAGGMGEGQQMRRQFDAGGGCVYCPLFLVWGMYLYNVQSMQCARGAVRIV